MTINLYVTNSVDLLDEVTSKAKFAAVRCSAPVPSDWVLITDIDIGDAYAIQRCREKANKGSSTLKRKTT